MAEPPLPTDSETFFTSDEISQDKKVKDFAPKLPPKIHSSHSSIVTNLMSQMKKQIHIPIIHDENQEELDFSNQHLSLSEISSRLATARIVKKLNLSGCGLTKAPDLRSLYRLEELNLSNNPLNDSDVLIFGSRHLHPLRKLDLSGCSLTKVPELRNLFKLEELNLSNNPLNAVVSIQLIRHLDSLRKLDLSGCGFTKAPEFRSDRGLEELNLSNNPLNDSDISILGSRNLRSLRKLDLSGCGLIGAPEFDDLDKLEKLEELNLSNNNFDHQDLLQKLNSRKTSYASDQKPLELMALSTHIFKSSKLRRIIFEDGVCVHSQLCRAGRMPMRENKWFWFEAKSDPMKDNWLEEFSQKAKSEKLTIETYHRMLKSLNIVRSLVSKNVESRLEQASTFSQCCGEILNYLPEIKVKGLRDSYSEECLKDLRSSVSQLKYWSSDSDDDMYSLKLVMITSLIAYKKASEAFSEMSDAADGGIFATILIIVSEILCNLTTPGTVAIRCLQFLQELHDLPIIRDEFSWLIKQDMEINLFEHKIFANVLSVHKINKILFKFVQIFVKPPPTVEEWPATIQLDELVYNPLIEEQFLKERVIENRAVSNQMELDIDNIIGTDEKDEGQNDVVEYKNPVIESDVGTSDNSITVNAEGGCFGIPVASAFLLFPPQAVEEPVTLSCSRVKHKDCEVKAKDAVSRILKIEPEGVTFKKPVTVLLSHSAYEDEVFRNYYELIVQRLRPTRNSIDPFPTGWLELYTEGISSSEDLPKGIPNPEVMEDYLPFSKATIQETCTLVTTTRIKSDQILIPTNKSYTFYKQYEENTELKITFPAGVTKEILSLKVQLLPAEVVLNKDLRLNENLVCGPVIKVSGQRVPFLEPVDVELTYCHKDVTNISEEFLPVESRMKFTTKYGLLLRSQKKEESKEWENLNEVNDVYVERPGRNQLKFSFSVKHFCENVPLMKTNDDSNVQSSQVVVNMDNHARHSAFVLAVHEIDNIQNTLHAVLMPKLEKRKVEAEWKVPAINFMNPLKNRERIFFCVPLSESYDSYHLPIKDYTLWFDPDNESELFNNTETRVDLRGLYMRFLKDKKCYHGTNHSTQENGRAKAPIHVSDSCSVQTTTASNKENYANTSPKGPDVSSDEEGPQNIPQIREVLKVIMHHCELFQRSIETAAEEKLKIIKAFVKSTGGGKVTEVVDVAGPTTTVLFSLACGITIATGFATFGIPLFCGAAVAGGTLVVKRIDKHRKQADAKKFVQTLEKAAERVAAEKEIPNVSSYLSCLVKDVAKELSRIFEYQLFYLKNEQQVEILARCAVELMLNLKKNDAFDRNTLLRKVLNGEAKKRKLLTCNDDDDWSSPDVFQKPGLRRMIVGMENTECVYYVRPDGTCDTKTYGYRGQFHEIREHKCESEEATSKGMPEFVHLEESKFKGLCERCSDCCDNSGKYFAESDIDGKYSKKCRHAYIYRPLHLLVQCPKVLHSFIDNLHKKNSFADFLKTEFGLQDKDTLLPVYRQHVPGNVKLDCSQVSEVPRADFTGSDFSHCDFTNSSFPGCDFTNCAMLFTKLTGAKMSGSTFLDTFISHSDMKEVEADGCSWTKTSVLHSRVDNANLGRVVPTIGDNSWNGTNVRDAIIVEQPAFQHENNHEMEISRQTEQAPPRKMSYV